DLKDISAKLLAYVTVSSPDLTQRQMADYYLADPAVYKKTVEALPKDKRFDSDGNQLSEAQLYNNAAESITSDQLNYSEDEKKIIYLFNQLNAVGNFATGTIQTDPLSDTQ
ncbi:penicillin-binding protein 2, partial [Streptococcus pneumoniae]|nr:penicillin-binding protein 2 [Streptococcus pneumoniae]